ncbi:XrtX-associated membrane protein [Solirubrum puertoriconensis]|uniref:Uncharacterized protein n=1 Tax=Solirubrum puertoriconensis TaxID=1751427 RepID=A0A9X0HLH4_SOLP1|nr:hypothetical protein [Solirubrum puertoriconensis]KUG08195.1 hypothetical protein ASU33_08380 [Solirubrum puertoriconensis]
MRKAVAEIRLPRLLQVGVALLLGGVLFWAGTNDAVAITALAKFWSNTAGALGVTGNVWREQPNEVHSLGGSSSLPAKLTFGVGYSLTCLLLLLVLTPAHTWRLGAAIYGSLFLLSVVLVLVGKAVGSTGPVYTLGRPIIDMMLNPLPIMVLIPLLHWLHPATKRQA